MGPLSMRETSGRWRVARKPLFLVWEELKGRAVLVYTPIHCWSRIDMQDHLN